MGWVVLPSGTLRGITDNDFVAFSKSDLNWPTVFMTGDGHRTPAFSWTHTCPRVKEFFSNALARNRLYAYVEVRPSKVTANLVPDFLGALYGQKRIIGWELSLFEDLEPSMVTSLDVMAMEINLGRLDFLAPVLNPFDKIISVAAEVLGRNKVFDIRTFEYINEIQECLATYYDRRAEFNGEVANKLKNAAGNYHNACMGLRCSQGRRHRDSGEYS